jgi:hypothetical protein
MALKAEGMWPCIVLGGNYGEDPARPGVTRVQISVRIDGGPSNGQICTYEDDVTFKSNIYVMRSCENVGWKGGPTGDDLNTLAADVAAWIKATGGKAVVEIKHLLIKNGKNAGKTWDKVNGIRRGAKPLKVATGTALTDAREAMRAARAASGDEAPPDSDYRGSAPPPDDVPHAATGSDDDIPF